MANTGTGKILIVDDEVELKNILVEALASQGYETSGFSSGEEALAALRLEAFDVLLTDLMMPGMDGIALVREALQIDPYLVAIMMTGQGTIQTAVDAMKAGTFDYVLKPFRLQSVMPALTRAMTTRHLRLENVQLREAIGIHELSETIAFTLDPQTVLSKLADGAMLQSQADEVSVLLPTADGDELYVAVVRGEKRERLLGERIPFGESISSWVARQRTPVLLDGEVDDDRFVALWPRPDIRSSISIPMLVAQKLVGVLNLNVLDKPRPFTLGQMKGLTILAGTAASALESASLYTQIESQRQRLDNIVANVPGVVWEAWGQPDAATQRINFVSDHVEVMLGYSVEEWLSTPNFWLQIVHPEDRERTAKDAAAAFASDAGKATMEFRWLTKDGRELWVESNSAVTRDEQGRAVGLRGVTTDISERKRAEAVEARRAVHALFRADVSAALAGSKSPLHDTLMSCAEAMVRHLDAAFARIWTFNHEEDVLELQASAGIYTHTDGAHARVPLGSLKIGRIAERRLPHISNDVPHDPEVSDKDWATREGMVAFAGYPLLVEDRLLGVMALFSRQLLTDDTLDALASVADIISQGIERQRAEEELQQAKDFSEKLIQTANVIILGLDTDGNINIFNEAAEKITGYTAAELRGHSWFEKLAPKDRYPCVWDEFNHLVEGGFPLTFENPIVTKDGEERHIMWQNNQVTVDGRVVATISFGNDITERKWAEAALRESEERYRDLVENAHDIIYSHDLKGNYTSINKAGEVVTGYSRAEALQLNLVDTVAPEDVDRAREMTARKLAGEHVTAYELLVLSKDGRRIPVEVSTRLHIEEGVPVSIQGIARDITERKRAEADLALFRRLVDHSNDGIFVIKAATSEMLDVNEAGCRQSGYTRKELLQLRVADLDTRMITPSEWAQHVQSLEAAGSMLMESVGLRKDGSTFPMEMSLRYVQLSEEEYVLAVIRDITERKLAQAERTRLVAAVEQTAESLVITDTAGNIEYVNPAFERITGYSKEEALGKNPRFLKSFKNDPAMYSDLWRTITRGDVWIGTLVNRKKDGTLFSERATMSAVRDESGKIVSYLAVKQDITHETQLEEQLRQSQKMEAIGQLAGGVAHDFNNLLTAINGYSSLALQRIDESNPIIKGYLEEIKKAGDRAANLTRQLLAFGRKQILQPLPINLNDIVSDMNKMLKRLIGEDIQLGAKLDNKLEKIKADPGQIEQVLVNLVVNARDAMPKGGKLTIETSNVSFDEEYASHHVGVHLGNYVMLAVSDTGSGMDDETQARIFEPFFTTKEKGKGTGLGLSTVYGIVKQSGGNIWVYSELSHGTTFKIYLPQIDAPVKTTEAKTEDSSIPEGSETVLLVEDEDVVRGLALRILEQSGYRVIAASGGEEALRWCQNHEEPIHLLLTDVVMPETSGQELAERLASLRPETRVLFMSGYTDEAIVHHGVLDANVEFIQKPFTPTALARKVRQVLDKNGHSQ